MSVPDGFKVSEVGVIPVDWDVKRLGELFKFKNGINADKKYYGQGIKFINVLEVIQKRCLFYEDIPGFITIDSVTIKSNIVQKGDILFNRTSETQEEIGLTSVYLDNKDVVFGGFVIRARPINDLLDYYFSKYAFSSHIVRNQIIKRGQGAIRANIGQSDLKEISIPLPPLAEQKAIAQSLSDVDNLITAIDKLITKKRNIKQGTMQELLTGKKRLPGFSGEWEVKKLEEITTITRLAGAEYSSVWKEEENGEIIALRGFNIGQNRIIDKDLVRISNQLSLKLNRSRLYVGDVVYPCVGTIGNAVVIEENDKYHIQQNIAKITPVKNIISSYYLVYFLMSPLGEKEVLRFNATSSQPNVLVGSLRKYRVPIPPLPEQKAIAKILTEMDAEIEALEKKREKYKNIKQGMMQELLTGKTRIIDN